MNIKVPILLVGIFMFSMASAHDTHGQASGTLQGQKTEPKANNGSSAAPSTTNGEYVIGPQDIVQIDVWKEPEITRTIPVRPDGKVSLPLLNDVQASGLTAMQLAGVIREGLTKFLTNPQVTVTVTTINSRRVFLTGEVSRTGALPLLPNMTVLQALSSAGGFTPFARMKDIYILRIENGQQTKYPFHYKDVVKGKRSEENILLQPNDVIVVP
jgi:polysaccharide export outer membrane protein